MAYKWWSYRQKTVMGKIPPSRFSDYNYLIYKPKLTKFEILIHTNSRCHLAPKVLGGGAKMVLSAWKVWWWQTVFHMFPYASDCRNMNKVSCRSQHDIQESVNVNCFSYIMLAFRNTNNSMLSTNRHGHLSYHGTDALSAATSITQGEARVQCNTWYRSCMRQIPCYHSWLAVNYSVHSTALHL